MLSYFIFFITIILGIIVTLIVRHIAMVKQIGSIPDKRMVHFGFIPHMGGLGFYLSGLIGILISLLWSEYYRDMFTLKYAGIFLGATIMLITGIFDDVKGLNARTKFIIQLVAASIVILSGCKIDTIINPFGNPIDLGILSVPLTVLWLIGVTNAINLLDGLDGLAAGVSAIVLATFAVLAYQQQDWMTYNLCIAFIGAILGFLYFNYHPASIFMGDTGSLFLGFFIAALAVKGLQRSEGNVALIVPVIVLSVPIGDTVLAFFRRLNKGQHPFSPDKDHLHHRLLFLGLSHRQAVHIVYLFSILFGFAAIMVANESRFVGGLVLVLVLSIAIFSLYRLGYLEDQKIRTTSGELSVIQVRKEQAPLSMRRFWHKFLLILSDIITLNLALLFTFWFRYHSGIMPNQPNLQADYYFYSGVWLILTIVFILFFMINGLYAMRWDVSRFDQVMRLSKVVVFMIAILFIITFDPETMFKFSRLTLPFYMFVIILFVNTGRLLIIQIEKKWQILEYSAHNTLLIGANEKSRKLLEEINNNPHLLYHIVGYVDEQKTKSNFDNVKYLGNFKKLGRLVREYGVEEVIIAIEERSRDDIMDIISSAQNMKVTFKFIPDIYDLISGHKTEEITGHPLIKLFAEHMKPWEWLVKRLGDILFAAVILILLLPVFIIIMIVQLFSGLYPFFVIEDRVGKHKHIFGLLRFNTGNEKSKAGAWLRRSGLAKLPILVNLLLGSITIIGPVMETPQTVKKIQSKINFYNRRFLIRPGILGWGMHPNGPRNTVADFKKYFDKELLYLENMSLMLDFRILIRSIVQAILQKNKQD
jgi:UDP-GlcNAc:undecaprenyl-phosphate GlcNAc-1-phosphate transferase